MASLGFLSLVAAHPENLDVKPLPKRLR